MERQWMSIERWTFDIHPYLALKKFGLFSAQIYLFLISVGLIKLLFRNRKSLDLYLS